MPFIKIKTNSSITDEQEIRIKSLMGKAIELVPGKSEEYLLLEFSDNCRLWLAGDNEEPTAYIEASIFGNRTHYGYASFISAVTDIFSEVLKISSDHIYIKFDDIPVWGVNRMCIDERYMM